jgi:hypothetical protein
MTRPRASFALSFPGGEQDARGVGGGRGESGLVRASSSADMQQCSARTSHRTARAVV